MGSSCSRQGRRVTAAPDNRPLHTKLLEEARVLQKQGSQKLPLAESLIRRACDEREKELGPDNPDTLNAMNRLTEVLQCQGKYVEAEPLSRRTLNARERVLGTSHPETLASLNNLAVCLDSQCRHDEAEPLYRRALKGREHVLGSAHPHTVLSVHNLAGLLQSQGKFEEAEPLARRERTLQQALAAGRGGAAGAGLSSSIMGYTEAVNDSSRSSNKSR